MTDQIISTLYCISLNKSSKSTTSQRQLYFEASPVDRVNLFNKRYYGNFAVNLFGRSKDELFENFLIKKSVWSI